MTSVGDGVGQEMDFNRVIFVLFPQDSASKHSSYR